MFDEPILNVSNNLQLDFMDYNAYIIIKMRSNI